MLGTFATKTVINALYYSGSASLANSYLRGSGSILMLHRVSPATHGGFSPNAHLTVNPAFLDELCAQLRTTIFEFVSMDEALRRILANSSSQKATRPFLAVTLDDGYRDNLKHAVPIFRKHQIPYTIYIAPGLVDGRATLWWEDLEQIIRKRDRLDLDLPGGHAVFEIETMKQKRHAFESLVNFLMNDVDEFEQRRLIRELCWLYGIDAEGHRARSIMNWDELRQLARDPLCTLGAHTIGHYAVARLPEKSARYEMKESANLVRLETGQAVRHLAYPYGSAAAANSRDFELAREAGFDTAVTTRHGVCYPAHGEHVHALPRISLNGHFQKISYVKTLLSGATSRMANKGARLNVA